MTDRPSSPLVNGCRHAHGASAFALIELMIAIALFGMFTVVAIQLIASSLRITTQVSLAEQSHRAFDAAVGRLRADVWTASKIDVLGPSGVTLELGRGETVTWSVAADGSFVRTESPPGGGYPGRQAWPTASDRVSFRAEPATLVLDVRTRRGFDNGTYRLASQVLLAGGGR